MCYAEKLWIVGETLSYHIEIAIMPKNVYQGLRRVE